MTPQEQKDLRTYCALLLEEYGISFSPEDPVIPALYILYRHTKSNHESNQVLASQIQEAILKIKPQEFHFHHPGEAWKFQMAVAFKWALGSLFILALILMGTWHWSRVNDMAAARTILQSSGTLSILFHRVKKNNEGIFFIDFTAGIGDSTRHFIEYEKLDKKTIRVYLGRESDNIEK
jgi:hypothetical protein